MSTYMLVARNKKDNSFKILGIKESWYNANGDDKTLSYKNTLGSIDLVTTRFTSREEMQARLIDKGYLVDGDYDFFVASKTRSGSANPVKFQEVIYRPEKNERMAEFRTVAAASHTGRLNEANDKVLRIFNKLLTKAYHRGDFYHMIQNGYTALPKKLVDALEGVRNNDDVPYSLKYQERWALESYPTIRNIIEALNRYDLLTAKYSNLTQGNVTYFSETARGRKSLIPKLDEILDRDFTPGQLSLLDDNMSEIWATPNAVVQEKVEEDVVQAVEEKKKPKKVFPTISGVNDENMLGKVLEFLTSLPLSSFKFVDNKLTFNFDVFDYELDDDIKKKLNSLLTGYLRSNVRLYLFHRDLLEKNEDLWGHDRILLQEDLDADRRDIRNGLLKGDKRLLRVYEWCRVYSACGQMNDVMVQQGNQIGVDEVSKKKK